MDFNLLHAAFAGPNGGSVLPPRSLSASLLRFLGRHLRDIWTAYVRNFEGPVTPPMP
ncbi:MAG: hypothetical protein JO264_22035 [Acidisphaera sp.]|nr:hypothetical protein [Acidisphaera sp.]